MRLFIDCDDTLVIYGGDCVHPHGLIYGTPYTVNRELASYIHWFAREFPDALIVIWSGGGRDYAEHVARLAGCADVGAVYLCKDSETFPLVDGDSVVFDDQPIKVPVRVWGPHDVGMGRATRRSE